MTREQIIEMIRESLRVEIRVNHEYTGGLDGGKLYRDFYSLRLTLDDQVISEVSLDLPL